MLFRKSIQQELDSFFKSLQNADFNIREVTKGALTQARAKLNPWAFQRLNQVAVNSFYEDADYNTWHGMRVLGIDGTRLSLPSHHTIEKEFGLHNFGPKADSKRSMALGSMLYDVLNNITLDAQIAPFTDSEKGLLMEHMPIIQPTDMLLLDRGYPCFWLLFLLQAKGINFCVRLKKNWWLKVQSFTESNENECIVEFNLPAKDRNKLKDYPQMWEQPIQCRLIKVVLQNGEIEILCTSLLDSKQYPLECFGPLYHKRWGIEEAYKMLKARIEIEAFSGKTATAVRQDFHAKVFLMTLCAAYAHPIEGLVIEEYKADENRKHPQKTNRSCAVSMTKDILIAVLLKQMFAPAIIAFDNIVKNTREIVRPNRKVPRKLSKKKLYSMNYKPL